MSTKVGWAVAVILLGVVFYMAHLLAVKPKEIVREVPKIITQEVVKEVPKEVIKEVPRDVIREVPVEKLVEKPIPPEYVSAYQFFQNWTGAKVIKVNSDPLRGITSVRVVVFISDSLKPYVSAEAIQNRIELELRKVGLTVTDNSIDWVNYSLEALKQSGTEIYSYSESLRVTEGVVIPRSPPFIATSVNIWDQHYFGSGGSSRLRDLAGIFDEPLTALLNDYLKANPPSR